MSGCRSKQFLVCYLLLGRPSCQGAWWITVGCTDSLLIRNLIVVPTILVFPAKSSSARPTLVKNLSVVMLRPLRTKEEEKPPYPHQRSNCRYCAEVNDIFQWYCLPRGSHITVQLDREERSRYFKEALHYLTGLKTVPQVFIGGQFIGDAEIIKRIHCNGVLQEMLNKLRLIQCNNGCQYCCNCMTNYDCYQ
ncbi:Glutaredoxin-2 [Trichinella spiralis]|uniref:Glutaredoxin-2 n=1 Tax=Trichinella spiralis TaxID=6334 RepID=A0ABR3KBF1_TRISP